MTATLHPVLTLAAKDILVEARTKDVLLSVAMFGVVGIGCLQPCSGHNPFFGFSSWARRPLGILFLLSGPGDEPCFRCRKGTWQP